MAFKTDIWTFVYLFLCSSNTKNNSYVLPSQSDHSVLDLVLINLIQTASPWSRYYCYPPLIVKEAEVLRN